MNATVMTTPAQLERLGENLRKLRLRKSSEQLEPMLQHAAAQELPYVDLLEQVLGEEVAAKRSQNIAMRTAMAHIPFVKSLETFDFVYQPSIDKKQVGNLATRHFIEHGDNVIILRPPDVGKTHLAVSLGLKAIEAGYRVLFTSAANLIAQLTKAHADGKFKVFTTPRLLVIKRQGANLFFQLISRHYERGPMMLPSNQRFSARGEVFDDRVISTAILYRPLHHVVTLNMRGNSYRLMEKLKGGLVRSDESDPQPGGENWNTVDTRHWYLEQTSGQVRWCSQYVGARGFKVDCLDPSGKASRSLMLADAPVNSRYFSIVISTCAGLPRSAMNTGPNWATFLAPLASRLN